MYSSFIICAAPTQVNYECCTSIVETRAFFRLRNYNPELDNTRRNHEPDDDVVTKRNCVYQHTAVLSCKNCTVGLGSGRAGEGFPLST